MLPNEPAYFINVFTPLACCAFLSSLYKAYLPIFIHAVNYHFLRSSRKYTSAQPYLCAARPSFRPWRRYFVMLAWSFRTLVVGGTRDSNALLIASALTSTKGLEPESKSKAGFVYRDVLDLVSRTLEVNAVMFVDALHRLHKWDRLFPLPGPVYPPCR